MKQSTDALVVPFLANSIDKNFIPESGGNSLLLYFPGLLKIAMFVSLILLDLQSVMFFVLVFVF